MTKIIKKNYESDFSVIVKLPGIVGESDFRLEFYTLRSGKYIAGREDGILTANIRDIGEGRYSVMLRNHKLKEGRLRVKAYCELTNIDSPDKIMVEVVPICTEIELWGGPSEELENIDVEILPQIVNITQIKEIGNLTLEIYTAYPTSYRSYSIPQFELAKKPSSDESYYYYYSGEGVGVFDELSTASDEHAEVATASADEEQTESSEEQTDLQTESGAEEGESV